MTKVGLLVAKMGAKMKPKPRMALMFACWGRGMCIIAISAAKNLGMAWNGQIYKALDSLEMEVKGRKKWGTLFNLPLLPLGTRTWELHKASNLDEVSESKVTQHQLRLCRWCFKSPQSWRQIQSRFTCFWWTSPVYGNCVTLPVTWEPHMIWPTFCSWMFPFRCDCCCCSSNFIYIYQNKGPNK